MSDSDGDDGLEDELIEIFSEEAEEIFSAIDPLLKGWKEAGYSKDDLMSMKRAYHTLKGSGRMVGASELGELAYLGEQYFDALSNELIKSDSSHFPVIDLMNERLKKMSYEFKDKQTLTVDTSGIESLMALVIAGEVVQDIPTVEKSATLASDPVIVNDVIKEADSELVAQNDDHDKEFKEQFDEELLEVFVEEAEEIIPEIYQNLESWIEGGVGECVKALQLHFHTLKGNAQMIGVEALVELSGKVEQYFEGVSSGFIARNYSHYSLIEQACSALKLLVEDVSNHKGTQLDTSQLIESMNNILTEAEAETETELTQNDLAQELELDLNSEKADIAIIEDGSLKPIDANEVALYQEEVSDIADDVVLYNQPSLDFVDDDLLAIFVEEAESIFPEMEKSLKEWSSGIDENKNLEILGRCFHTLKGSGVMVGVESVTSISYKGETYFNGIESGEIIPNKENSPLFNDAIDALRILVKDFSEKSRPSIDTSVLLDRMDAEIFSTSTLNDNLLTNADEVQGDESRGDESYDSSQEVERVIQNSNAVNPEEIDNELIEIFVEDVEGIVSTINACIPRWKKSTADETCLAELCESFHNLNGSGRLIGAIGIGKVALAAQNLLNKVVDKIVPASEDIVKKITDTVALFPDMVESFRSNKELSFDIDDLEKSLFELSNQEVSGRVEATTQPVVSESSENESENDIIEVFLNECLSHLEVINTFIIQSEGRHISVDGDFQRAIHTLKGSSNMADVQSMIKITTPTEIIAKDYFNYHLNTDEQFILLMKEFYQLALFNVNWLREGSPSEGMDDVRVEKYLKNLADHHDYIKSEVVRDLERVSQQSTVEEFMMSAMDSIEVLEEIVEDLQDTDSRKSVLIRAKPCLQKIKDLSRGEQYDKINSLLSEMIGSIEKYSYQNESVQGLYPSIFKNGFDSLVGLVDSLAMEQPLPSIESVLLSFSEINVKSDDQRSDVLLQESNFSRESEYDDDVDTLSNDEEALAELVSIFLTESDDIMDNIASNLNRWKDRPDNLIDIEELQRECNTLKVAARLARLVPISFLAYQLENVYEAILDGRHKASLGLFSILESAHAKLVEMIEIVQLQGTLVSMDSFVETLREQLDELEQSDQSFPVDSAVSVLVDPDLSVSSDSSPSIPILENTKNEESKFDSQPELQQVQASSERINPFEGCDIDDDLLVIFLEEAQELVDLINKALEQWRASPHNNSGVIQELQRHMHTLKGGARMAGVTPLGDCAHEFEDFVKKAESQEPDNTYFKTIDDYQKTLLDTVAQVKAYAKGDFDDVQTQDLHEDLRVDELSISLDGRFVLPDHQGTIPEQSEIKSIQAGATSGEMVRVAAPLLEQLVNLAGESSIIRGRVEQEVADIGYILSEMEATIDRLREQFRRLDLETEAQIRSHHETSNLTRNEGFDPLEMDEYSAINQLTRALSESTSDLSGLKDTLQNKKRDTETLLLQQSRTNSQLQESLMKTRMVPFSRLVPRLQRVVRQVATELGKDVEFKVVDSAGEIDRTIMEKMVAPLEHMLRNAVDHGMEMPEERISVGKSPKGRITLHLTKEGAQAVLRLTDDGRGIDTDKVRTKAIEKDMMLPDVQLSETELLQFIYQSGFSTASSVTQVSGRGVGMDVVNTEIKTLGGSLRVHSTKGVGTQFTTRLPLTVSTTRSLMVKIHDNLYAVPMSQIEGVVRISPLELDAYFQDEDKLFEYAGVDYHVRYLGYYLSADMKPVIDPSERPKPAMLVRGADRDTALQVDEVVGSREIVVKTVGSQLASISGLSGATILGDGNVIVILDLHALIRAELAQYSMSKLEAKLRGDQSIDSAPEVQIVNDNTEKRAVPIVMVVDDSVTVRKVTTRFLERNGFEVATAKDGVDAVSELREVKPDLVLLDIEMPRMDGFEVASFIRHDSSLKHIPIIMITSRTGEKHRERAMSIGVNEYLGKPFQETILLEMIGRFVKVSVDD